MKTVDELKALGIVPGARVGAHHREEPWKHRGTVVSYCEMKFSPHPEENGKIWGVMVQWDFGKTYDERIESLFVVKASTKNNLTVDRVLKAYEAGELTGVLHPDLDFDGWGIAEDKCGCAMTAIALHETGKWASLGEFLLDIDNYGTQVACDANQVSWPYMLGFTDAFDGNSKGTRHQIGTAEGWEMVDYAEYDMGFDHGLAARKAVIEKYSPGGINNEPVTL